MFNKISFIGGDMRQIECAKHMLQHSKVVSVFGFDDYKFMSERLISETSLESCLHNAEIVVLGLPAAADNFKITTPYSKNNLLINDLFNYIPSDALLFGGKISEKIRVLANQLHIQCFDYLEREEFAIYNALPTAEGAIQIAMQEIPTTLHGCKCLVVGFGRIGKLLAKLLSDLGCDVVASARKASDIAWISCFGHTPIQTKLIGNIVDQFDIIFNTVPNNVLNCDILTKMNKNTLIIDLASKPGGVDFDCAKTVGINTIWALSLPGKVAPESAGKIICDTIFNIIDEL